jgi:Ca-activated chloride channel family protein
MLDIKKVLVLSAFLFLVHHTLPAQSYLDEFSCPYLVSSVEQSVLPLIHLGAEVNIAGTIAEVELTQVYVNSLNDLPIEAIYVFPGSTRAAISGLEFQIKDRMIKAQIEEKSKARAKYASAKKAGKRASLLAQKNANTFQMNIANIMPGDTLLVKVKYTEFIERNNGLYQFVLPTTIGQKFSERTKTEVVRSTKASFLPVEESQYTFDVRLHLNAPVPIQKFNSPSHKVDFELINPNRCDITLNQSEQYSANRDFIFEYNLNGPALTSGILLHEDSLENFFSLQIQPPQAISEEDIPRREYLFVVDVSGSMRGFPIETSKTLLEELLSGLRPGDVFNVVLFEFSSKKLFKTSVPANRLNINKAISLLRDRNGMGGTNLLQTMSSVYEDLAPSEVSRSIIIITDGFIDVEKSVFKMIRDNLNLANVFAFGIGESVNRLLIEGIAYAGLGEEFIVTNKAFAKQKARELISFINQPALTNIQIDFGPMDVYDFSPKNLPDLLSDRPVMIYGKYRGRFPDTVHISGTKGKNPFLQDVIVNDKKENPALKYLWARNTIKETIDFENESEQTEDKIIAIGLKYSLLTSYTSFIAIDSEIARDSSDLFLTINQPVPVPNDNFSSGGNAGYRRTMNATGAVSRVAGNYEITLRLPSQGESGAPIILLTWQNDKTDEFKVSIKDIFDDEVFSENTADKYYWLEREKVEEINADLALLKISSQGQNSQEVGIKLVTGLPKYHYLFDLYAQYALEEYMAGIIDLLQAELFIDANTLIEIGLLYYPNSEELDKLRGAILF